MSELERAAAEHLRTQRETAKREAQIHAEDQQTAARADEAMRRQTLELFEMARRRGAPTFQRYTCSHVDVGETVYTRTAEKCVVAMSWREKHGSLMEYSWAISSNGALYTDVHVRAEGGGRRHKQQFREQQFRDKQVVITTYGEVGPGRFSLADVTAHFVAIAAALMESVWLAPGKQTGIQADGSISYRL